MRIRRERTARLLAIGDIEQHDEGRREHVVTRARRRIEKRRRERGEHLAIGDPERAPDRRAQLRGPTAPPLRERCRRARLRARRRSRARRRGARLSIAPSTFRCGSCRPRSTADTFVRASRGTGLAGVEAIVRVEHDGAIELDRVAKRVERAGRERRPRFAVERAQQRACAECPQRDRSRSAATRACVLDDRQLTAAALGRELELE